MYYSIKNSTGKDVGNIFPQVSCLNQDLAHSIQFDEFSNFDREILFKLEPKAKLTDVLSQAAISAYGFLVNNKVKQILEGFNLMEHRYYKCLVKDQNGVVHEYYWLHLSDPSLVLTIDDPKSKFFTLEYGFRDADINLTSYDEYKIKKVKLGPIYGFKGDSIKLNETFDPSLDMFCIPIFGESTYLSKTLSNTLIQNISGVNINPSNVLNCIRP